MPTLDPSVERTLLAVVDALHAVGVRFCVVGGGWGSESRLHACAQAVNPGGHKVTPQEEPTKIGSSPATTRFYSRGSLHGCDVPVAEAARDDLIEDFIQGCHIERLR